MDDKRLVEVSRYLSRHLRHQPEELQEVVDRNDKRRFAFDETGTRIRANQGHSVEITPLRTRPLAPRGQTPG